MAIDKLVFPAKENAVQEKINEIIDNKQDLLVSGTNIKTVNGTSLLGSGNLDAESVFIAEYDDNSYSDITNAITSGKAVFLRKGDDTVSSNTLYYPLSYIDDSNSTYYFSMVADNTANVAFVDNTNSWSYYFIDLQAKLISGTSIKTINNESLLGSGNIDISSGGTVDQTYDPTSTNAQSGVAIAGANFLTSSDLTNYVTTNTDQNITGVKTYVGQKRIGFKQSGSSDKLGFTLYNNSGTEKGYLEYNPSNTVDNAPLMTLGNYASSAAAITHIGFRKYSSVSGASGAYNLLAPLISDARTPFNLTTTYTNFYLPLGFTDGTTMVTTANTGVVDLSSLLPTVPTKISDLTDDTATYPIDKADTLTGLTATVSELNVLDGITATTTELNYVDGVTSAIQTQLNSKQENITGAATTITSSNLTASRVLISNGSGKVEASDVTSTELGYLDGVTSAVQTQFNTITGKIPSAASTSNQLADKSFVNSTVQTATANFRGNWDTWSAVPTSASSYPVDYAGSTTPTVNDYLVVQDASGYTGDTLEGTWRFKYSGTWSTDGKAGWLPEYQVNDTPLTSAQSAALNSGITSSDVTLIGTALQPSDVDQTYSASSTNAQSGTAVALALSNSGFITGITSNDVTTALGYIPYSSANPSGYQANVIETIKVNGTAQTVTSKEVDITVPTVNNATITFTQGGVTKGSITLNQSTNQTIALDSGGGGGASALTDLSDVTLTSPSSGDALCYNGSDWINSPKTLVTIRRWS